MKKLNKILSRLSHVAGAVTGACCCKDNGGIVRSCEQVSREMCDYTSASSGLNCQFYEGRECFEVCIDSKPGMIDDTPLPSSPGTPTSPNDESMIGENNTEEDCLEKVKPLLDCLDRMNVGNSKSLRAERIRLQKLVRDWAVFRCPQVERICSGTGGTSGPVLMEAYNCYCNIHREYFEGLKRIVEQFCSQQPPLTGPNLNNKLNELCRQFKLARNACKTTHGVEDPIRDNGTRECGFSN